MNRYDRFASSNDVCPTVLLVDDDRGAAALAESTLADAGFRVTCAGSCRAAELALADDEPALLLLADLLPDGPGLDWLARIRSRGCAAPVVLLASPGHPPRLGLDLFSRGVGRVLVKPLAPACLIEAARSALCGDDTQPLPVLPSTLPFLRPR